MTKATCECDLPDGLAIPVQHLTRPVDALMQYELNRWDAKADFERPEELPEAQAAELREVLASDGVRQVRVDVAEEAIDLPAGEPAVVLRKGAPPVCGEALATAA